MMTLGGALADLRAQAVHLVWVAREARQQAPQGQLRADLRAVSNHLDTVILALERAIERARKAAKLLNAEATADTATWYATDVDDSSTGLPQFARYIAANEEAPVDPLWAEAMTFTRARGWNGSSPERPMVKFAHAALCRGIELAGDRT